MNETSENNAVDRDTEPSNATSFSEWQVAVDAPIANALTYLVPEKFASQNSSDSAQIEEPHRGQSVVVPLGSRKVPGVLLAPTGSTIGSSIGSSTGSSNASAPKAERKFKIKAIHDFDRTKPLLHEPFLQWLEWLAKYYVHPIGQVFELSFPPLAPPKKARASKKRAVNAAVGAVADTRVNAEAAHGGANRPTLTDEQQTVIRAISEHRRFETHLVHGVTGSGKTEIYMALMEDVIKRGQQGLVLVPEISLTPQLIDRFTERLGSAVAVIHSHLTPREKTTQWWQMVTGEKKILIGARSALFCPLPNLGLIVVDEEHEPSFKQEEKLKYNARDAAVVLGKFSNCPVVLGSATPSLESWQNALAGRYRLHELKSRVAGRSMPDIEVIDLRSERDERKISGTASGEDVPFWCSETLLAGLRETLNRNQQAALFLNRRGIAQAVVCPHCGWVPACPNCEVKLTLHGKTHLICHYCGFHENLTPYCRECKEGEPRPLGLGTEMLENDLKRLFPVARVARMDRDEIQSREDLEDAIRAIENREVDLLVGTQMIAKGLDFPGLTFVGLVLADVAFNLPDFRASERSFQLLTQVAGRSGRHLNDGLRGRVVIQTYNPEHACIQFTKNHDFSGFMNQELEFRRALSYPPFGRLASFRIHGLDVDRVVQTARQLRARCDSLKAQRERFKAVEILGPAQSPLAKIRNQHRWQLLLKARDAATLGAFCREIVATDDWYPPAVKISVDVDPLQFL